jgi:glutamyl-tRNA synthetase
MHYRSEITMSSDVRVRFAPSPTGYLHIGGARTAIYNWLFARHTGGTFIVRIEDTDRNRFVPDAIDDISASLRWLGIDWDEGPEVGGDFGSYFQSERLELYRKYARQLVDEGKAYRCYCSSERLEQLRKEQETAKQWVGYDRYCLNMTNEERREQEAAGAKSVIRFKIPREGRTVFQDLIKGELGFENNTLDDFVLLKSDGFPTYHLANVIDDHSMKISQVMRGDEWIPSTPRHVLLYRAFGWIPPQFAHLPLFLAPGGGKLSKRHGATSVREYREKGYLPKALFNFLLLLGWNPGTERELFSLEEAAREFTMERINSSPVALSFEKLDWFNGMYIRTLEPDNLARHCLPYLQQAGLLPEPCLDNNYRYLVQIMPLIRERLKSIPDIADLAGFFFLEELPAPAKELLIPKKMNLNQSLQALEGALSVLKDVDSDFKEADLETTLRGVAINLGLEDGQVFMPLRVAISGKTATPGIFETMHVLGKERVIQRVQNAVQVLKH